ncbi:DUF6191 domain-containing protein [Streptomyces sp. SS7]|uniref:DUF6191 domain-containing protein n=1 Tax=Streptomyces sp. SS7 TaxID=3108485 RepID=UPI0030EBBFD3
MGFAVFHDLAGARHRADGLKERQSAPVLRDAEEDGAPPRRTTVDLDGGVVVVRRPQA